MGGEVGSGTRVRIFVDGAWFERLGEDQARLQKLKRAQAVAEEKDKEMGIGEETHNLWAGGERGLGCARGAAAQSDSERTLVVESQVHAGQQFGFSPWMHSSPHLMSFSLISNTKHGPFSPI